MELWTNPVIKSIMILFLISTGMDLLSRVLFDTSKSATTDPSVSNSVTESQQSNTENKIYQQKNEEFYLEDSVKRAHFGFHPINVSLCTSCGYGSKLEELKNHVHKYFPNIQFFAVTHPISMMNILLGYLFRIAQVAGGCFLIFGDKIFEKLGMPAPPIYHKLVQNKILAVMIIVMLGNMVVANLSSSGAFEIIYNGKLIHSKLASGTYPDPDYIVHQLYEFVNREIGV